LEEFDASNASSGASATCAPSGLNASSPCGSPGTARYRDPAENTSERFGMVDERFGVARMVIVPEAEASRRVISPS
jgi:hypothetical protein